MMFLIATAFTGCATIHKPVKPEDKPEVIYRGTAHGDATIVDVERPDDLQVAPYPGDYAPPDIISTPGGWYAPSGLKGSLPRLGTMVVVSTSDPSGIPADATANKIVECPKDRERRTVAEQAACTELDVERAAAKTK
ncbi:hypothetical protein HZA87_02175 [Candidatus Uhrbacteria bacterium]|nr:hypothetical protein [Candidatus Uhrbacteria bacterium]